MSPLFLCSLSLPSLPPTPLGSGAGPAASAAAAGLALMPVVCSVCGGVWREEVDCPQLVSTVLHFRAMSD